jgi:hypothetical protein
MEAARDSADADSIEQLLKILLSSKKQELRALCREAVITKAAFANFILGSMSGATPWDHRAHHREFVPPHLNITKEDRTEIVSSASDKTESRVPKFLRKISAIFDERRLLSGHLFFTADLSNWHLLYFDQRDISRNRNHWDGGSHIHLINHLWPKWTAQTIWNEFCTGNPQMKGALHVRFSDERPTFRMSPPPPNAPVTPEEFIRKWRKSSGRDGN